MIIAALAVVALLVWALERAHRRGPQPRPRLAGSSDVLDRDAERVRADLAVLPQFAVRVGTSTMPRASSRARTRTASGTDIAV